MGPQMQAPAMETNGIGNGVVWPKSEAGSGLREGITGLMKRWTGLQMALQNQWGGPDSRLKYEQLVGDLLACLSHSKGPLCLEEMESFLHERMLLSFNTEMEDGSIDLVAEQLMMLHEDYLHGCYA